MGISRVILAVVIAQHEACGLQIKEAKVLKALMVTGAPNRTRGVS